MAGYREFQTGEVLTAANVNSFLMEQATMTFADAAARDAALAGVLRAGLNVYLEDTDRLQYYDGTDWQNVPNEADVDAAGGLVVVKSEIQTAAFTESSVNAGGNFVLPGLSITHSLADASNRLILIGFVGGLATQSLGENGGVAFHDGTGFIGVGDAEGARPGVGSNIHTASSTSSGRSERMDTHNLTLVHSPDTTDSRTYTLRIINTFNSARPMFVNRYQSDRNDARGSRTVSTFTLMEIKV